MKTYLKANQWLLLRRTSQFLILALFALPPLFGIYLFKGTLSSSIFLDTIPLTDPLLALQTLFAGLPRLTFAASTLWLGAALVLTGYILLGGRSFCAWVCPVNLITDLAAYFRRIFKLPRLPSLPQSLSVQMLLLVCFIPLLSGVLAWEWLNPIPALYRAILFGSVGGLWLLLMIFVLDLFISERAWCGHLCPTGAFYAVVGKFSPLTMNTQNQNQCDKCMKCFDVCPEKHILSTALKIKGAPRKTLNSRCTLCGRCKDVCAYPIFQYNWGKPSLLKTHNKDHC